MCEAATYDEREDNAARSIIYTLDEYKTSFFLCVWKARI